MVQGFSQLWGSPAGRILSPKIGRNSIAGWSSQVAREAHNLKVVGSNPTPAIRRRRRIGTIGVGHLTLFGGVFWVVNVPVTTIIASMIMSIVSTDYLPYQTAAKTLGLQPETVRRYIHSGEINAESVGRTYYIHRDEVARFQRDRKPRGRQPKNL